jgi:glucose-1-phosphate cytidylyltransferase
LAKTPFLLHFSNDFGAVPAGILPRLLYERGRGTGAADVKVVILAGGKGTRLSEETDIKPKPMVDIGGRPILWHIMKIYSQHGFNDFVVLLGYRGYIIKEYFANYFLHQSDVTIDLAANTTTVLNNSSEPWRVTLLETGEDTLTGSRIKRSRKLLDSDTFMLTYGDAVSDININGLIARHKQHGGIMTMTAVQPDGRFGTYEDDSAGKVRRFLEKPRGDGSWINGGFFVCEPALFDHIPDGDSDMLEERPFTSLVQAGQLWTYKHHGFWKCMDTLRDKAELNQMWNSGRAKWKTWS